MRAKGCLYNNGRSFADRIKGVDIKLLNGQGHEREIFHDSISPEEYNANVEKYIVSVNPLEAIARASRAESRVLGSRVENRQ